MRSLGRGKLRLVALAIGATTMVPATSAGAATVSAFEEPLFKTPGTRYASARVDAEPGEANRLSIVLTGKPGSYLLQIRDEAEPLQAGNRCEGGGGAGALVTCALTVTPSPVTIVLGNRGGTVDASSFPNRIEVRAGSGDDSITAGNGGLTYFPTRCGSDIHPSSECDPELGDGSTGADRVATGGGDDAIWLGDGPSQVSTGGGNDFLLATAAPNGPDRIDLGAGERDIANFNLRQTGLSYTADDLANDGAPGEGDAILGAEFFAGGNGDDLLVGDGDGDYLVGNGGSDLLIGAGGNDWLIGEVGGGSKLGRVAGISLNTFRWDYGNSRKLRITAGGDRALGGPGTDQLHLDGGNDEGFGGPGKDLIRGNDGRDRLFGQPGRNRIDGGPQRDRCRGGGRGSVVQRCET
ncbi:MAG TPA: calcium-binding protein [Solirubrobacterales bacterium]|nr:calcium-binding protein [Solirubrobacterales bacterium]